MWLYGGELECLRACGVLVYAGVCMCVDVYVGVRECMNVNGCVWRYVEVSGRMGVRRFIWMRVCICVAV